jgi:hypothetical protein
MSPGVPPSVGDATPRVAIRAATDRWRDSVLAGVLFAVALWHVLGAVAATPFNRDEARWIHRASYLQALTEPLGPLWIEEGRYPGTSLDERFPLRGQPPLGGYLMGLGLLAQGRDLTTNGFWNMDHDDAWNEAHGNMPAPEDLLAGRRTNAVVAALTVVTVFFLGCALTNWVGGLVAGLVLLVHPLLVATASIAGSDPLLTLLVALAALAAYRLGERPTWGRAILLGVLLGLGGATKLSPLLLALPLAALGALLLVQARWRKRPGSETASGRFGWQLVALPAVAFATFVAVYPYLWRAPLAHTADLFAFRAYSMELQAGIWPNAGVESRAEALQRVGIKLGKDFSASGWVAGELRGRFGADWRAQSRGLDLALALVGAEVLAFGVIRRGLGSGCGLAALLLGGEVAGTVLGMHADFARYHLPIALVIALCVGVVAGTIWAQLRRGRAHSVPR